MTSRQEHVERRARCAGWVRDVIRFADAQRVRRSRPSCRDFNGRRGCPPHWPQPDVRDARVTAAWRKRSRIVRGSGTPESSSLTNAARPRRRTLAGSKDQAA
jgi:hypothetical protein